MHWIITVTLFHSELGKDRIRLVPVKNQIASNFSTGNGAFVIIPPRDLERAVEHPRSEGASRKETREEAGQEIGRHIAQKVRDRDESADEGERENALVHRVGEEVFGRRNERRQRGGGSLLFLCSQQYTTFPVKLPLRFENFVVY